MGGDAHFQVEVSRRRPVSARFPFAPEAQAGACIHPRRDVHLDLLFLADDPGALAGEQSEVMMAPDPWQSGQVVKIFRSPVDWLTCPVPWQRKQVWRGLPG